jgi:hypothetical protein
VQAGKKKEYEGITDLKKVILHYLIILVAFIVITKNIIQWARTQMPNRMAGIAVKCISSTMIHCMTAGVAIAIMLTGEASTPQGYVPKNKRNWWSKLTILQWINQKVDKATDLLTENLRWLKGRGKIRGYYQLMTTVRNVAGTRGSRPLGAILAVAVVMAMEHRSHAKNLNLAALALTTGAQPASRTTPNTSSGPYDR